MKSILKIALIASFLGMGIVNCYAQIQEKDADLKSYIKNKYSASPEEGVKILQTGNGDFLVSMALTSADGRSMSSLSRVTTVKARRNALVYVQGSRVTSEQILTTEEKISDKGATYFERYFDEIKEESEGFVQGMATLASFNSTDGKTFINVLYRKL